MNLQDFNTLAEAQLWPQVNNKKQVGSGQARGYLVGIGVWKTLRIIRADLEHPLSDLADAVIITAADASSFFGLDPETAEGQGNIASIGMFVDAGILTQPQADTFLGLALSNTHPHANATEHDFQLAKNTVALKPVKVKGRYVVINVLSDCEKHNPRLVARKTNPRTNQVIEQRVNNFYGVEEAGLYDCVVPDEWMSAELFVDDVYVVIEDS